MSFGEAGRKLEFRLLGPLEVASDGALVPVGGARQQALLAFMVLHGNEVVRRDSLIDALWGETPPASAQNGLQVLIHGLRKALGKGRIETFADGYRLRIEPGELDLGRFQELLDRDPGAALELWRGPALAGVEAPFVAVEAARLEELRLAAVEARMEGELAVGAHELLIPELERLIVEHPFRERLRGQLMLALYRAGRQADALDAYRAARRVLVDELGIDPGPELQQLERRILRQDPTLLPLRVAPLPAPTTSFVGRELELAAVSALLGRPEVRLVTLTGAGGAGKTRLALELAARHPGGAVFVDLAPLADSGLVPAAIAAALGVSERADRPLVADLKDRLAARRLMLVLDNFEHVLGAAPLVGELLRAASELTLLVTSRARLQVSGEHEYVVPPLSEREAIELFVMRARAVDPGFAADSAAIGQICGRLDALPLAIELAAARARLFSAEALLARLEPRLPLLAGPVDAPERQRTLRATLNWSYGLLSPDEQRLFRRLGVFAGSFDVTAAEAACAAGLDELTSLADKSLVRRAGDRLALLETIGEYARERLVESGEEEDVRRAHARYYLSLAEQSEAVMYGGDQAGWWGRLEADHDNLRAALTWSATCDVEVELRLAVALWAFWSAHGHLSEGRRWLDDALRHAEAGDRALRANATACAGALAYRQGDWKYTATRFEEAFALYRELGDELGTARMLGELGNLAVATGDYANALHRYEETATLLRRLGDERRVAQVIANMGSVASIQRDFERARTLFEEALELQQASGNREAGAISLHNLGRIELALDRLDEAGAWFEKALQDARELGYREIIAYCLEAFGELALARRDVQSAARLMGAAGALFDELGLALAPEEAETYGRALALLREQLRADELDAERAAGAAEPLEDAMALALGVATRRVQR